MRESHSDCITGAALRLACPALDIILHQHSQPLSRADNAQEINHTEQPLLTSDPTFSGVITVLNESSPVSSKPTLLCFDRVEGTTRQGWAVAYDRVAELLRSPPMKRFALNIVLSGLRLRQGRASYATAATSMIDLMRQICREVVIQSEKFFLAHTVTLRCNLKQIFQPFIMFMFST